MLYFFLNKKESQNSFGLQETKSRRDDADSDDGGIVRADVSQETEIPDAIPIRNGGEIITTRVFVHNESLQWREVAGPFERNAKISATVADMIDQREFNQTIS